MDILIIVFSGILIVAGLIGCVVTKLPGTLFSYLGIAVLQYSSISEHSVHYFIRWGVIIIAIQGLDYIIPAWGKRKFGGSCKGVWGCLLGMLAGAFFGCSGLVVGAVLGAFVGELIAGKESNEAIHHAIVPFTFFILSTIVQLIVAGIFLCRYISELSYFL